jgi:Xaa-Pro aminopeptidase
LTRSAAAVAAVFLVLVWLPLGGQVSPHGGAQAYVADLSARRAAVMEALGKDAVLVLWSAPPRVYSTDTNYEYRQESNLLYLTGVEQEDTILVLVPGREGPRELIFVQAADPRRELWEGRLLRPAEVSARTGIAQVHPQRRMEAFHAFMDALFAEVPAPTRLGILDRVSEPPVPAAADAEPDEPDTTASVRWARGIQAQHPGVRLFGAADVLEEQRSIKTPYEQALLRRSVEISADAHVEGMKAARPGRWEYQVEAAIEYAFHRSGALSWGYPSIVASGPNATTLHYVKSTRQLQDGDLLLVDAAGNFQGITGDITRTYPVNGRFTPEQRVLYDLVLRAEEAGLAAARPGGTVSEITRAVRAVLGEGLLALGLVADPAAATGESAQISFWFPHGPTHGIGIDVHDPLGRLDPGAAFVIEPGLYIRPDVLERLTNDPATSALAAQLRPAVERYQQIGIRVEDSFLMTPTGPEMLSGNAPRLADEIERLVGTGP